jgi:hypothetical protein
MLVRRTGTEEGNAMNNDLERYIYHHAGGGEVGVCVPLLLEFGLRLIIVSPSGWEDMNVYDSLQVTDRSPDSIPREVVVACHLSPHFLPSLSF